MKRNPTHIIKLICILAGLAILPLRVLLGLNPYVTESLYSNGLFQVIRICLDYTVGLLPVPIIYILVLTLLFVFVKKIIRFFKKRKKLRQHVPGYDNEGISFKTKILRGLITLSAYAGAIVFLFYFSW
ncbi:MAG: DUF3810 domain-containing protein, partial [bacterium]|nr:DUF3810 domain-containing protein [bacterium]